MSRLDGVFGEMLLAEVLGDLRQLDEVALIARLDLTKEDLINHLMPLIKELIEEGRL